VTLVWGHQARTEPDYLYIIRFGQVSVQSWSRYEVVMHVGDLFGELAILGLSPDGRRMRTVKSCLWVGIMKS